MMDEPETPIAAVFHGSWRIVVAPIHDIVFPFRAEGVKGDRKLVGFGDSKVAAIEDAKRKIEDFELRGS